MVYKRKIIDNITYSLALITLLVYFCFKANVYLVYILNLNYWSSNSILAIVISLLFFNKLLSYFKYFFVSKFLNFNIFTSFFIKKKLLSTLIVGTIALHPLAFYLFTVIFLLKFFAKKDKYITNCVSPDYRLVSACLSITLALGGFWGLQSIAWGYVWVSDTIEWLLFAKVIYVLFTLHYLRNQHFTLNENIIPSILLSIIFLVRLNIIQTRHSFISSYATVYIILFFYIVCCRILFFQVKTSNSSMNTGVLLAMFFTFIFTCNYMLLAFKYIFVLFLCVLLTFMRHFFLTRYVYLHLFLIVWSFIWSAYFTFFYLQYLGSLNVSTSWSSITEFAYVAQFIYQLSSTLHQLEGVVFLSLYESTNTFFAMFSTAIAVFFNNYTLFYIFFITLCFFFKMGWI